MKAISIPFRVKDGRGRLRPVKPADVANLFEQFEAQVKETLESWGWQVTDLNVKISCNVPCDLLAEKDGQQVLIDARGGYRAAEFAQIESKRRTMDAFRSDNYPGANIMLAFGNMSVMQEKRLKRAGQLVEKI